MTDTPITQIENLHLGQASVRATITQLTSHRIRNGNLMIEAIIADSTGSTRCVWFSKNLKHDLEKGNEYIFTGKFELKYGRLAFQKPQYKATGEHPSVEYLNNAPFENPQREYRRVYNPKKQTDWGVLPAVLFWGVVIVGAYFIFFHHSTPANPAMGGVTCVDVTSYDYNWNNDVRCTNPDGSTFYTNYAGGNKYGYHFSGR